MEQEVPLLRPGGWTGHCLASALNASVMSDLFGAGGQKLLRTVTLAPAMRARVNSCSRLIEALDFEVEVFTDLATHRLAGDTGYRAIQALPGVGPVLGRGCAATIAPPSTTSTAPTPVRTAAPIPPD